MPVTDQTPEVTLYDSNGVEMAVANGVATPVGTRGLFLAGTDGTNTRFISTDTSGRQRAVGAAASGAAVAGDPVLVAGSDGANARALLTDTAGRLITTPFGGTATSGIATGTVTTTATTNVPIRASTYNEPAANAQRSISSANAADAAAGTGARQVQITYYDVTGAGPFTETVTLNGVTPVNTANVNICFIEKLVVVSVGSGSVNAGILTLFNAITGGGGTLATMNAGDNQTLWAQHYVATGKTCNITSISGNNSNTSNGTVMTIKAKPLTGTGPERQVSDFVRGGGGGIQATRSYGITIQVTGPARVLLYGAPEGTPSITSRGSFDFYDQ
jgi:hypothetical protein